MKKVHQKKEEDPITMIKKDIKKVWRTIRKDFKL